ncbi:hypothetical protein LCGC14_3151730 [marine sediment metagenome]|uniref:3D domain-containing protein n=1 Tax=marine sediment metagenome TaxID=412755 RepID=A0A0F8VTT3_9ZZZZ
MFKLFLKGLLAGSVLTLIITFLISWLIPTGEYIYKRPIEIEKTVYKIVTAYSSTVDQTDSSPFTTASNQKVRKGIVAYNCADFGTKIKIEGRVYEVQDRMNKRFGCSRVDIWMKTREEAKEWGKQELEILFN